MTLNFNCSKWLPLHCSSIGNRQWQEFCTVQFVNCSEQLPVVTLLASSGTTCLLLMVGLLQNNIWNSISWHTETSRAVPELFQHVRTCIQPFIDFDILNQVFVNCVMHEGFWMQHHCFKLIVHHHKHTVVFWWLKNLSNSIERELNEFRTNSNFWLICSGIWMARNLTFPMWQQPCVAAQTRIEGKTFVENWPELGTTVCWVCWNFASIQKVNKSIDFTAEELFWVDLQLTTHFALLNFCWAAMHTDFKCQNVQCAWECCHQIFVISNELCNCTSLTLLHCCCQACWLCHMWTFHVFAIIVTWPTLLDAL